jgi:hypothetical protein
MQIRIQNPVLRSLICVLFSADTDSNGSVLPLPTLGWPQHRSCLIQSRILRSSRLPVQNHTKYNKPSGGRSFRSLFFNVVDPDPQRSAFVWMSWIWIRIGNADPDPEAWKLTKIYKYTVPSLTAFQKAFFTFVCKFLDLLPTFSIFSM